MTYIGIIGRRKKDKRNFLTFNEEIVNIIYQSNCIPIGILVDFDNDAVDELNRIKPLLNLCGGFILQGGCEYYNIDILITNYLHMNDLPTLGICLGMQTMAMAFQGIMSTIGCSHNKEFKYVHEVEIKENSKLYNIIQNKSIDVNSRHNDYIVSTNLDIVAKSDIIEAIEDKSKVFFIGVQWHPESINDENSKKLFNYFFEEAKKSKKM